MNSLDDLDIEKILKKANTCEIVEDYKSACDYYELAALKGDRRSISKLITLYSHGKYNLDIRKAIFWLEEYLSRYTDLTRRDNFEFRLGLKYCKCYFNDKIKCDEDKEKAIYWLNNAYEHNKASVARLKKIGGLLYKLGDYEHSFLILDSVLSVCLQKKYLAPIVTLGKCHLFGKGTERNPAKAFELFQIAAKEDFDPAKSLLSRFFNADNVKMS